MANNYESLGERKKAEETYYKAIEFRPQYWANYNYLSVFYYKQGNFTEAIKQLKHVLNLRPDYSDGYSNLGAFYFAIDDWNNAQKTFEQSLSIKKSAIIFNNLGVLDFYKGNFEKAAEMYNEALKFDSSDYQIWGHLAESYSNLDGQKSKSIRLYQRAIELAEQNLRNNPNDVYILSDQANYYAKLGNREKAIYLIKKTELQKEIDIDVMFTLASTYELLNERNLALSWIEKALKNGYSIKIVEHTPEFKKLILDTKFKKSFKKIKINY